MREFPNQLQCNGIGQLSVSILLAADFEYAYVGARMIDRRVARH
jgi:hypothetical protein